MAHICKKKKNTNNLRYDHDEGNTVENIWGLMYLILMDYQ